MAKSNQFPKAFPSTKYPGKWKYSRKNGTPVVLLPGKPGDREFAAAYRAVDKITTGWVKAVRPLVGRLGRLAQSSVKPI